MPFASKRVVHGIHYTEGRVTVAAIAAIGAPGNHPVPSADGNDPFNSRMFPESPP